MQLELVASLVLDVPDILATKIQEDKLPPLVCRLLEDQIDKLLVAVPILAKVEGEAKAYITSLHLGTVQWRADLACAILRQVRDGVTAAKMIDFSGEYEEPTGILDRRRRPL